MVCCRLIMLFCTSRFASCHLPSYYALIFTSQPRILFYFCFVDIFYYIFINTEWQLGHMLCELRHVVSGALCIYCALLFLTVHFCTWLCIYCAFLFLTVHWLCTQAPNPKKESSWEIFRNQGKMLSNSRHNWLCIVFCYQICAEFLAEAVRETALWYFIYGSFYFCSLDSREFWFMKCI